MRESLLSADTDTGQDHFPLGSDYKKLLHGDMSEVHLLQLHAQRKVQKKSAAMGFSVSVWFN